MTTDYTDKTTLTDNNTDHSFIVWNEEDSIPDIPYPSRFDCIAIFISTSGSMTMEINTQPATIDDTHIQIYTRNHAIRIIGKSKDFKCVGFIFPRKFWEKTMLQTHAFNAATRIMPCLEVTQEQKDRLLDFYRIIKSGADADKRTKAYNINIVGQIITSMFYELGAIYKNYIEIADVKSGCRRMMSDFLELLYDNCKSHRDVAFYADKMNISQRYFTTAVRKCSGLPALKWIEKYVILEAQILLKNTDKPVKEIASELNFDEESFFCKYFKRITGVSPDQYRHTE